MLFLKHFQNLIQIQSDSNWGGEGSLGCGIGYGYLHRIPYSKKTSEASPLMANETPTVETTQSLPQNQYFERKSYELQRQPLPPPPQPPQQHFPPPTDTNIPPVVVHDHKHQQEVFNANIEGAAPASSSVSSMFNSLANISLSDNSQPSSNYQGQYYTNKPMAQSIAQTTSSSAGGYPLSTTLPMSQQSYAPQTSPYTPSYGYTQPEYSSGIIMSSGVSTAPTYGVQSFTTPISLPGMPPLTVSATLPTDKFPNTFPSQSYNTPNLMGNQSMVYPMAPNQTNSPQL